MSLFAVVLSLGSSLHGAEPAPVVLGGPPVVEELEHAGVKGLRATFLVGQSADVVLDTLWDVRAFQDVFPEILSLQVIASGPDTVDARFVVDAVFMHRSYTLRRSVDRVAGRITWRSIAGDVKSIVGSWTVLPAAAPNVSQVTYMSFVDVGFFVPTALVRDVALGKVEAMVERVRRACMRPK